VYGRVKLSDSNVINALKKVLTNHVKKQPGFAWMNQVSSGVYQKALIDLKDAFNRYHSSKWPHPTFFSRREGQSFTVDSSNLKVVLNAGNTIKIPTVGTFQRHEPLECGESFPDFYPIQIRKSLGKSHSALTGSAKKSNKPKNQ
jgi:putative transposase